ncbi:MAG: matrixin family metalloprotease [Deltaproteobacteria bacterium]|nr:MAG: matrixin family metalloprotease [Deltaproteobacteria bacterium]
MKICKLSLVLCLLVTPQARAFVCTRTNSMSDHTGAIAGASLSWFSRRVPYAINDQGTLRIPMSQSLATLRAAFLVWQNLQLEPSLRDSCSVRGDTDLTFVETDSPTSVDWVGYNYLDPQHNTNVLIFRDHDWPHPSNAGDVIALTTTTFSLFSGEIVDADIEFNSAKFAFSAVAAPGLTQTDLLNTAVHEVGHFLGLSHCSEGLCGNGEVMEPTSFEGEVSKRLLKCDDLAGIVFKYPRGRANGYCEGAVTQACGHCAPPLTILRRPTVEISGRDPGRGPNCTSASAGPAGCMLASVMVWRRRSRKQTG